MKIQTRDTPELIKTYLRKVARFRVIIFVLLITGVYAYLIISVNSLGNQQPTTQTVNGELGSIKTPKLDQRVVKQLEALRDNSVSVKTLFDQARDNPFNE